MKTLFSSRRFRWAIEVLVIVGVFFGVRAYTQRGTVHRLAPPIAGALIGGGQFNLAAMRGRPVLVQFWATWCPVCRLELSSIDSIAKDYSVITVAQQSGQAAEIRRFLKRRHVQFPVIVDPNGVLARSYGVRAVPASFVVGPAGRVRFVEVGYTTGAGLRARLWLAR